MQSFRLALTYTEAELAAYERLVRYRAKRNAGPPATIGMVGTSIVLALIAGMVSVMTRTTTPHGAGLVVVLVFAGVWAGMWTPALWGKRRVRQAWLARRAATRVRFDQAEIIVSSVIVMRRPDIRAVYKRSAIQRTGLENGLLLLWMDSEGAIAIPLRLLTPEQQAYLLAFSRVEP